MEGKGQNYTPKEVSFLQMKLSGCPVAMHSRKVIKLCSDSGRGGEQEIDDVRERGRVWFTKFSCLLFLGSIILDWHSVRAGGQELDEGSDLMTGGTHCSS